MGRYDKKITTTSSGQSPKVCFGCEKSCFLKCTGSCSSSCIGTQNLKPVAEKHEK